MQNTKVALRDQLSNALLMKGGFVNPEAIHCRDAEYAENSEPEIPPAKAQSRQVRLEGKIKTPTNNFHRNLRSLRPLRLCGRYSEIWGSALLR